MNTNIDYPGPDGNAAAATDAEISPATGPDRSAAEVPPVPRPYQVAAIDALRASYAAGHRAPILMLPTGGGGYQPGWVWHRLREQREAATGRMAP